MREQDLAQWLDARIVAADKPVNDIDAHIEKTEQCVQQALESLKALRKVARQ